MDAAHRFELGWTVEAVREADAAQGTKLGNSRLVRIKKHGLTSALFASKVTPLTPRTLNRPDTSR